jgi:hypothetical protein
MLEVAYLPFFLYYGTLIFDVGQGKLAWYINELSGAISAISVYAGAW